MYTAFFLALVWNTVVSIFRMHVFRFCWSRNSSYKVVNVFRMGCDLLMDFKRKESFEEFQILVECYLILLRWFIRGRKVHKVLKHEIQQCILGLSEIDFFRAFENIKKTRMCSRYHGICHFLNTMPCEIDVFFDIKKRDQSIACELVFSCLGETDTVKKFSRNFNQIRLYAQKPVLKIEGSP